MKSPEITIKSDLKSFNFPGPHAAGAPLVLPMDVFPWAMAQWGAWKEGAGLKGWSFMGFWETLWGFHVFFSRQT